MSKAAESSTFSAFSDTTTEPQNQMERSAGSVEEEPKKNSMTSPAVHRVVSLEAAGGIPSDDSPRVLLHNTVLLSRLLQEQSWQTVLVDATFHLFHGVHVVGVDHLLLQWQPGAALRFHRDYRHPQRLSNFTTDSPRSRPPACITFFQCRNLTLTTSSSDDNDVSLADSSKTATTRGLLYGGGPEWWGVPFVGYAQRLEHRPYLLLFNHTTDVHLTELVLQDSPFYHVQMTDVVRAHVHHVSIVSRRTKQLTHSAWDLSAFNTDGLDIAGHNVHVHDVDIWTQDDCIAVKDNLWSSRNDRISSNMLFERITASGLGLTIGSIGGTTVQNITFRDSLLYRTYKGIYTKFRAPPSPHRHYSNGLIQDILYQNVTIIEPLQYALWLGPAQQNGGHTANPCHAAPCSLCWPHVPGAVCRVVPNATYRNITLRDVDIINPRGSLGVLLGSNDYPIQGLVFDNVLVRYTRRRPTSFSGQDVSPWFPGLNVPVEDVWVQRTEWTLVAASAVALVCLALWLYRTRRRPQQNSRMRRDAELWAPQCSRRQRFCVSFLLRGVVTIPILLLATYELWLTHQLHKVDAYFVCEGIVDGVATGTTHPVPPCFQDLTENDKKTEDSWKLSMYAGGWIAHGFWLIVVVLTLLYWANVARSANTDFGEGVDQTYTALDQMGSENASVNEEENEESFVDEEIQNSPIAVPAASTEDPVSSSGSASGPPVAQGRRTLQDALSTQNNQFTVKPIGFVRSVYKLCVGTPRQGLLAPDARGCIELDLEIDAADGLADFSHVWIVFLFHLNTVGQRRVTKIRPPAAGGAKVGVLATRSPHRPNPVGLTLAKLVRIRTERRVRPGRKPTCITILDIAGLDLCDGTPVLDIKPYVPVYDSIPRDHNISLPPWVAKGLDTWRKVEFTYNARMSLVNILQTKPLDFYGPDELSQVQSAIVQVLRMDVRSTFQTKKARQGASQAQKSRRLQAATSTYQEDSDEEANHRLPTCTQQLDRLLIHYTVHEVSPEEQHRKESQGSGAEDSVLVTEISYLETPRE